MSTYTRLTIYTDGASRGNPGPAAVGVHIVDDTTKQTVEDLECVLGVATNNVAEYRAVLYAVEWLLAQKELLADALHITFRLDSQVVALQLSGQYQIHDLKLRPLAEDIQERLSQLPGTHAFEQIPREENTPADRLANHALDTHA